MTWAPGRGWLLLLGVCAGLSIWRRPDAVLTPQLWAEDGVVFFLDAWRCGLSAIAHQYAGYLHVFPRLTAWAASWAPAAYAPHLYAAASLVPPALVCRALASPRLPAAPWARVAMVVPLALPPMAAEVLFAPSYGHWYLTLLFPLWLASRLPATPRDMVTDAATLLLAAGSSPAALHLMPLLVVRLAVGRASGLAWAAVLPAVLMTAVQAATLVASGRLQVPGTPGDLIALAAHAMTGSLIGRWAGDLVLARMAPMAALAAGLALVATTAMLAVRRRHWPAAVCAGCALVVWTATIVSMRAHPGLILADRYHVVPVVLLTWAVVLLQRSWWTAAVATLLVPLAHVGAWRVEPRPDRHWDTAIACLDREGPCVIPINPDGWAIDMQERLGRRQVVCGPRD